MKQIAIEGIDGAGKTSVATEITNQLAEEGLNAMSFSPFRDLNTSLGMDVYNLWRDERQALAASLALVSVIDTQIEEAKDCEADLVIFDRHWMSALVEISATSPAYPLWLSQKIDTALIDVTPETAIMRCANDLDAPWMSPDALAKTRQQYKNLSRQSGSFLLGVYRSENDITPEAIAHNILWDLRIRR